MHCLRSFSLTLLLATLLLGAGAFDAHRATAQTIQIPFNEVAQTADLIFLGTVERQTSRLNAQGKMILTDVSFSNVEIVHATVRSVQARADQIQLTYAGGTVGDVSISVSESPHLETGHRYLVFLQDDGAGYANPIVGGDQGIFEVIKDEASPNEYLLTAGGKAIVSLDAAGLRSSVTRVASVRRGALIADQQTRPATEFRNTQAPAPAGGGDGARASVLRESKDEQPLPLTDFLRQLTGTTLKQPRRAAPAGRPQGGLFYYRDEAGALRSLPLESAAPPARLFTTRDAEGQLQPHLTVPYAQARPVTEEAEPFKVGALSHAFSPAAVLGGAVGACGYQNLDIVMEMVPQSWWSWQVANNNMAIWNKAMDVFRYVDDDGSYGNNSRNEFVGFPSNDDLKRTYGDGIQWHSALAVTISYADSRVECGRIYQTDVAWNPAYGWTTDLNVALEERAWLLSPINLHELGHVWGMQRGRYRETYDYDVPTVMQGGYQKLVEDGWGVHAVDANLIRRQYADQRAVDASIRDVGVESYYADNGLRNSTTNARVYRPGDSITLNKVTVENIGRNAVSDLRLRFYLSTNNNISTSDYQMGGYWYWSSFGGERYNTSDYTTTIPSNLPPGTYYVGAIVTIDGFNDDDLTWNNRTFFVDTITVTCNGAFSFSPSSRGIGAGGGAGSVTALSTGSACGRAAVSSAPSWLSITSGGTGTGGGTIYYSATANLSGSARWGGITINGATHTVSQPAGCLVNSGATLGVPTTFNATLLASDCLSRLRLLSGAYRPYADRVTFNGTAGQRVAITLQSGSFDTYLYLIGPDGALLMQDDDSGGGTNSRIPASGFITLPASGTYTLEITSYWLDATGAYQLTLSKP